MMPAGQPASATVVHRDGPSHANSLDGKKRTLPARTMYICRHCFLLFLYSRLYCLEREDFKIENKMNNIVGDSLIQSSYANISHTCSFSASTSLLHLTWQYTVMFATCAAF